MTAPVILVRRKEMHRAALAFRAARGLAVKLRHALIHTHAGSERMSMIAISGDDMIVVPQKRNRSHRDRFLADIKMEKSAHLALVVELQGGLLETPDADHLAQEARFSLRD